MTHKVKSIMFSALAKAHRSLAGTGLGKIPGILEVYDMLWQLSWPEETIIEVQGSKMYLDVHYKDPSMRKTFQAYALNKVHERSTTELFKEVVKEGDVVVDLGANIGYFTLLAAKLVGKKGKVYSFEPEPRNFGFLKKNIELNGYSQVAANQKAIAESSGKVKLFICSYDTGHHTINKYDGIEAYKPEFAEAEKKSLDIERISLDEFLRAKNSSVNVIKMDVEGAEMLALSGMDRTIRENKNLKMFVEFFPLLIKEMGSSPEEFARRLLEDYGFSMYVISDDYSMHDFDNGSGSLEIKNINELMGLCTHEKAHVNLFLTKAS